MTTCELSSAKRAPPTSRIATAVRTRTCTSCLMELPPLRFLDIGRSFPRIFLGLKMDRHLERHCVLLANLLRLVEGQVHMVELRGSVHLEHRVADRGVAGRDSVDLDRRVLAAHLPWNHRYVRRARARGREARQPGLGRQAVGNREDPVVPKERIPFSSG